VRKRMTRPSVAVFASTACGHPPPPGRAARPARRAGRRGRRDLPRLVAYRHPPVRSPPEPRRCPLCAASLRRAGGVVGAPISDSPV